MEHSMNRRVKTGRVRTNPTNGRARFWYYVGGVLITQALVFAVDDWEVA